MIALNLSKPFLKWAGGKTGLLPQIIPHIPAKIMGTYYEPFLGGGAMFFRLQPERAVLSDSNAELINAYVQVRDACDRLIQRLHGHQHLHSQAYYYQVRGQSLQLLTDIERAARFIYLNKTCFNGLHRENKSGQFNVPIGSSKTPWSVDKEGIKAASLALQDAEIVCRNFKDFPKHDLKDQDFVYLDPPYQSVSKTSDFTSYTRDGFTGGDQVSLRQLFGFLDSQGVPVALSNSDHSFVREMYDQWAIHSISARRNINSKSDGRGCVGEVLVTANCREEK